MIDFQRAKFRRYRVQGWLLTLTALMLLAVDAAAPVLAQSESTRIAAAVLLDSSGSMKRTDPGRLRVPAAQLFVSLLRPEDRAAAVSFSDAGYPVAFLTPADEGGRARLLAGIDKVSSKGAFTNLHAALERGMQLLEGADAGARKYIILLSDGRMDTGDADRDRELVRRIQQELLPALREHDIKVYSIAFTRESDMELLRAVADRTGGVFQLVERQEHLHQAFVDIFEQAKAANMLPLDAGRFEVDGSVQEFSVLAGHGPGDQVTLQTPDGKQWDSRRHPSQVRWLQTPRFDLITVPQPTPGAWALNNDDPGDRTYAVTELSLQAELEHTPLQQGQTLRLRVWLSEDGERVLQQEILSQTEFSLVATLPDGNERSIALAAPGADGVTGAALPLDQAGPLRLTVIARSTRFQRQVRHLVQVLPPAPAAEPSTPSFVAPPIELPFPTPGAENAPPPPKALAVETPKPTEAAVETASEVESAPLQFRTVLIAFLIGNGVLAVVIGATVWWRHRKTATSPQEPTED